MQFKNLKAQLNISVICARVRNYPQSFSGHSLSKVCSDRITSVSAQKQEDGTVHIVLQFRTVFINKTSKALDKIDVKNILNAILQGTGQCDKDLKKVMAREYTDIHIHLSPENNNENVSAKIFAL